MYQIYRDLVKHELEDESDRRNENREDYHDRAPDFHAKDQSCLAHLVTVEKTYEGCDRGECKTPSY